MPRRRGIASRRFLFMIDHASEEDIHLARDEMRCAGKRIAAIVTVTLPPSLPPPPPFSLLSSPNPSFPARERAGVCVSLSHLVSPSRSVEYWNFEKPGCSGRQP